MLYDAPLSPNKLISRRRFIHRAALAAGAGLAYARVGVRSLKALGYRSPNKRLNIAGIGAGGQAGFNRWEKAARYDDFRRMLDKEHKNIDAVVIAIPDQMHATAALWCMQLGLHVYLEKPLTRTAWEARLLTRASHQFNVATQMVIKATLTTPPGWHAKSFGRARSAQCERFMPGRAAQDGRNACRRFHLRLRFPRL